MTEIPGYLIREIARESTGDDLLVVCDMSYGFMSWSPIDKPSGYWHVARLAGLAFIQAVQWGVYSWFKGLRHD